jgi:subtilisin-like proprotein convertase family protein
MMTIPGNPSTRAARTFGIALLASTLVAGLAAEQAAAATRATRSNTATIAIPDSSSSSSTIVVSERGRIKDLDVTLVGLSHTFPDDLDIMLIGPTGAAVPLMSDVCGGADLSSVTIRFDDEGEETYNCATSQRVRTQDDPNGTSSGNWPVSPTGTKLAKFDGTRTNGQWTLAVIDDALADTGSIANGWQLHFTVKRLNVKITKKPNKTTKSRKARFAFRSVPGAKSFKCSIDGKAFRKCGSPKTYRHLKPGRHVFRVKAKGDFGQPGSAKYAWRIRR